jgi:hypothetical protein
MSTRLCCSGDAEPFTVKQLSFCLMRNSPYKRGFNWFVFGKRFDQGPNSENIQQAFDQKALKYPRLKTEKQRQTTVN